MNDNTYLYVKTGIAEIILSPAFFYVSRKSPLRLQMQSSTPWGISLQDRSTGRKKRVKDCLKHCTARIKIL